MTAATIELIGTTVTGVAYSTLDVVVAMAPNHLIVAMGAANGSTSPLVQLVPFALVLAIFYFIILMPMRRRQKKVQDFLESLKVGDKIVTTGGLYGSIVKLHEKSVQLQIADKVRIEVARSAVGGYQGQDPVVTDQQHG